MGNYTENGGNRISDNTTVMSVFQSGLPHAANYRHTNTRGLCCYVLIKKNKTIYIYVCTRTQTHSNEAHLQRVTAWQLLRF